VHASAMFVIAILQC